MMNHCWGGLGTIEDQGDSVYRPHSQDVLGADMNLSLRDPNNWPHASFNYDPRDKKATEVGAHGGEFITDGDPPELQAHLDRVREFVQSQRDGTSQLPPHLAPVGPGWRAEAAWQFEAAGGQEGKDLLQASIPFVYDVEKDYITVGHPGMLPHDVMPGQGTVFTPGGICEGLYEPGGKVIIKTTTTIPFSTFHLLQLWYHSHPGLEVTSLEIENESGDCHKVA